jgi:seryl-tRNA synthetase
VDARTAGRRIGITVMLDLRMLRDQRDEVVENLAKRMDPHEAAVAIDAVIALDVERRSMIQSVDELRRRQKEVSALFGRHKRDGTEPPADLAPGALKQQLRSAEEDQRRLEADLDERLAALPNVPANDVLAGDKEANQVVSTFSEPPKRSEDAPDHVAIAGSLGLIDFERGTKLAGSGSWIYTGPGARLEWGLINYFISHHLEAGYEFMLPPHLLLESAGFAAGQFPKFSDDVFHIAVGEGERGRFLLPTAETAIIGVFQDELLDEASLPTKVFAYSPCYRSERAGFHADERGTIRGQQFNKVEIFQFTTPNQSAAALEEMIAHAEALVRGLGLHYQVSKLAARDVSATMKKTFDIEIWIPSVARYKEVSSVSWAGDYQARRANLRYRPEGSSTSAFPHTLNGSALATSRLFPALLEQNLQPDGSVLVPEVLQPFTGLERLTPRS